MRYAFNPQEEAFREEVKKFAQEITLPEHETLTEGSPEWWAIEQRARKQLAQKGWLAMSWPKKYGGSDASVMKQLVFTDEWTYAGAPGYDGEGIGYIGPAIMVAGTEEQKVKHLGGIARGEVVWCQGYSEPEAGSDLASLRTRAVQDGDDWIINGQKIWTSQAHYSDWILLLARTDPDAPKHRGITMFLVDMKSPGVSVRPIIDLTGDHPFNETFFDNVRVPSENIVGEVNRGWYVGMTLLDFERSSVSYAAISRRALDEVTRFARENRFNGKALVGLPHIRNKLIDMAVDTEISYMLSYQIAWIQSTGEVPNKEASEGKVFATEAEQRNLRRAMEVAGLYGQLVGGSQKARLSPYIEKNYLKSIADTIQSGTSEVQRYVISTRGLGLPKQ